MVKETLRYAAILGNVFFILWMTWNAIDEAWAGSIYQKLSYIGLTGLLLTNIWFLTRKSQS